MPDLKKNVKAKANVKQFCFRQLILILVLTFSSGLTQASEHAVILQYHHVSETTPKITSISPAQFKWHLDYLEKNHFTVWPLSQITRFLKEGLPLPDKCVAITFDDAYRSIYTTAFPLLKLRKWPFTLFLNTDTVGNVRNSLTWDEIQEMNNSVAEIANHSHTHAHLIRYKKNESPQQWRKRIIQEVLTAQQLIDTHLSTAASPSPRLFAYPYGEYSIPLTKIISELGYVAVGQQSGPAGYTSPSEILPRFPMGGIYTTKKQFIEKLKTYPLPLETNNIIEPEQKNSRPILKLGIDKKHTFNGLQKQLQCYVSGQGKALIRWDKLTAYIQAKENINAGRSRYNCTAPVSVNVHGKTRHGYYWYSQLWIKRQDNGQWYKE